VFVLLPSLLFVLLQLQVQMEHPEDSEPIGTIVGHVFLAVFQLGMSESCGAVVLLLLLRYSILCSELQHSSI
jgi:hypothetical protein